MMDLMVAGRSQREILDSIPFYKENKLVQEALKRVEQYIEEKSLNVEKTRPKEEKGEIQKTKSQKEGGYELMSKVTFEEDELAVVALFQENTRKDTIDILKDTLEALEETKEDPLEDDLLETIASAISKLQMIEDKYYYSLDLNRYLNNLEDDAYEE